MHQKKIGLAILGSTGSIGTQTLEAIEQYPEKFDLQVLTAGKNSDLLIEQAVKYRPNKVVISDHLQYKKVQDALWSKDIQVYCGEESLCEVVESDAIDLVLSAIVGYAGLKPTLHAIEAQKNIALANKETLVVAGELITERAKAKGINIYPVDSEHSAIFQCLLGEFHNKIEKIYLTASGGSFRGYTTDMLKNVSKEQALMHPNWNMGAKITVDSATLMNKGFEVIEAKWLFALSHEQIDVVIHPQSVIHSIVEFEDGSMKAQMGVPDMRIPILFALSYPQRWKTTFPRLNFSDYAQLTFEQPDKEVFYNLQLAYQAMEQEGTVACMLNAANEIAVDAFLNDKIRFLDIATINQQTMEKQQNIKNPSLNDYIQTDQMSREIARELIARR